MNWINFDNPDDKIKILDYTYTSEPSINTSISLQQNKIKLILFYIASILSFGFVWLLSKWSVKKKALFTFNKCNLQEATHFLIQDEDVGGQFTIVQRSNKIELRINRSCVSFKYHDRQYLYIEQKQVFVPVRYQELGLHLDKLKKDKFVPLTQNLRQKMLAFYGQNVMKLQVQSLFNIFVQQMLTPYEVFQTYGIILWIYQQYYIFAGVLLSYSLYVYWSTANKIKKTQQQLAFDSYFDVQTKILVGEQKNENQQAQLCNNNSSLDQQRSQIMRQHFSQINQQQIQLETTIIKRRQSKQVKNFENSLINNKNIIYKSVSSHKIVPGDIIILNEADIVPCDCILLRGQTLVNQKYSSGQNYLVKKQQIQNFTYTRQTQKNFVLYLGTQIIKIKSNSGSSQTQLLCLVINTNYNTLRGKYLRAIRYQGKHQQNFFRQTIYYIYIILVISIIAYLICLTVLGSYGKRSKLFLLFIDLLITAIPPTLPTILNVGIEFVIHRLKRHGIFCIFPKYALTGGRVDTILLKGEQVFGRNYHVQSATIGTKGKRGFGLTFSSLQQYYQYLSSQVSFCDKNQLHVKQKQRQQFQTTGQYFTCAIACCHTLQFYKKQIQGSSFQKKIYQFSQAKIQSQNSFSTQEYLIKIQKTIRTKNKNNLIAVVARLSDKKIHSLSKNIDLIDQEEIQTQINTTKKYQSSQEFSNYNSILGQRVAFIKGPPQKILSHCLKQSFPQSSYSYIVDMAQKGFTLFCYAMFKLQKNTKIDSKQLLNKQNYTFLGFMILQQQRQQQNITGIQNLLKSDLKVIYVSQQRQLQAVSKAVYNEVCDKNKLIMCNINKQHQKIFCKGNIQWQSSSNQPIAQFATQFQQFGKNHKVSLSSQLYQQLFMRNQSLIYQNIFNKIAIIHKSQLKHSRNLYSQIQKRNLVSCSVGRNGYLFQSGGISLQLQRQNSALLSTFYTKNSSLNTIVTCLKVCRAGLSTNFHCFNMMILFTLTQLTSCFLLNLNFQNLSNQQMLYEDLFITFPIFITINLTLPSSKLSKQLPPSSFFSLKYILSTFGLLFIQFIVQLIFVVYLNSLSQFSIQNKLSKNYYIQTSDFLTGGVLSSALFILTNNIYLGIVLSTSISRPFRKPFYTNPYYTLNIILIWLYNIFIVIFPKFVPEDMRPKNQNEQSQFVLVLALILGNLVMVAMYMYQNLLSFVWLNGFNCFRRKLKVKKQLQLLT